MSKPPKLNYKERYRENQRPHVPGLRQTLYDVIFESDTRAGRWFDIVLLVAILLSIVVVSLETVPEYQRHVTMLFRIEIVLTLMFTLEYGLRLFCVRHPLRYASSFWGVIDLLSILPIYITLVVGHSTQSFVILRSIRLLRVFRVLKLWRMMDEADELGTAVWNARNKIIVFLTVVLVAVSITGTLMFHIENWLFQPGDDPEAASLFTSIPQAMYWAIITMTTVGYGDVVPQTAIGKMISAVLILLGYSLIIVPSTFVTAEIITRKQPMLGPPCPNCGMEDQRRDADYCFRCGEKQS